MSQQQQTIKSKRLLLGLVVVAIAATVLGVLYNKQHLKNRIDISKLKATVLSVPRPLADFKLTDNRGKAFTKESLKGHWTMLFFGYTNCPGICPTTMTELNKMHKLLKEKKIEKLPTVVMISIDPRRDTRWRLNRYVKGFNKDFLSARGSKRQVKKMTRELGIVYLTVKDAKVKDKKKYTIDHSGTVVLVDPHGDVYAFFSMPHAAANMAHDYQQILLVDKSVR